MQANNLSRRVAITGMAAAVAVPVTVCAGPTPDTELEALGRRIEEISAAYADAEERSKPNWDAWAAQRRALPNSISDEEYLAASDRVNREFPIAFPTCDDLNDAMGETGMRIMAIPAQTLAGLKAKAKLAKHSCHLWDEPDDDAGWDHLVLRNLIDAVLQVPDAVQS